MVTYFFPLLFIYCCSFPYFLKSPSTASNHLICVFSFFPLPDIPPVIINGGKEMEALWRRKTKEELMKQHGESTITKWVRVHMVRMKKKRTTWRYPLTHTLAILVTDGSPCCSISSLFVFLFQKASICFPPFIIFNTFRTIL